MSEQMQSTLLEVKDLKTHFPIYEGIFFPKLKATVRAVDGVNLQVREGEILGLVGESGCGKSTLGRSIIQLIRSTEGSVYLGGKNLAEMSNRELRQARSEFQMIFQDPYASLNPRMTVYDTLAEPMILHKICRKDELPQKISELMETVGLAPRFAKKYPHEFSGGQRQRIAIARALALKPRLIIADEPVSALDVSIQSQILNLLAELSSKFNLTMIFISHDLSVIRHICDRVAVMYLGKIVELSEGTDLFRNPLHPYTQALLSAIPIPDPKKERANQRILLEGDAPSAINPPSGCSFHPRCRFASDICRKDSPQLQEFRDLTGAKSSHSAACTKIKEIHSSRH